MDILSTKESLLFYAKTLLNTLPCCVIMKIQKNDPHYSRFYLSNCIFWPLFSYIVLVFSGTLCHARYMENRRAIIQEELQLRIGGDIKLSAEEEKANIILMTWKKNEIEKARTETGSFLPSQNFLVAKDLITNSKVYQSIKLMPKGAILHLHDGAMLDAHWLVENATYDDHCYICIQSQGMLFHFFKDDAAAKNSSSVKGCQWNRVQQQRRLAPSVEEFDKEIYGNLTVVVDDPASAFVDQNDIWRKFQNAFGTSFSLLQYAPVFRNYVREGILRAYKDGVQYIEIRAILVKMYQLDGTNLSNDYLVELYRDVTQELIEELPDFVGTKLIISDSRFKLPAEILETIKETIRLYKKYSGFVVGFDLVGQEDKGHPLLYYLEQLQFPSQQAAVNLPYFFHAGETDWQGQDVDENLVDALLLNTSRIGHGYAMTKHPVVKQMFKDRDIAIEINPISNQVLMLVNDLRNHPANEMFATGQPLVISSDDPSMWGADPLSHDFYVTFMALGGSNTDLATMKKLCLNSFKYSSMTEEEKSSAIVLWEKRWTKYIDDLLEKHDPSSNKRDSFIERNHKGRRNDGKLYYRSGRAGSL